MRESYFPFNVAQMAANHLSPPEAALIDIGTPNIGMGEFMQSKRFLAQSLAAGELVIMVLHARIIFASIVGMFIMSIFRKNAGDASESLLLVDIPFTNCWSLEYLRGGLFCL